MRAIIHLLHSKSKDISLLRSGCHAINLTFIIPLQKGLLPSSINDIMGPHWTNVSEGDDVIVTLLGKCISWRKRLPSAQTFCFLRSVIKTSRSNKGKSGVVGLP